VFDITSAHSQLAVTVKAWSLISNSINSLLTRNYICYFEDLLVLTHLEIQKITILIKRLGHIYLFILSDKKSVLLGIEIALNLLRIRNALICTKPAIRNWGSIRFFIYRYLPLEHRMKVF
jgi:hypothetical protein